MTCSISAGCFFRNASNELCEVISLKPAGVIIKIYRTGGPRYYKISYAYLKKLLNCDTLHIMED